MKKKVFTILFGPQLRGREIVIIKKMVVSLQNNFIDMKKTVLLIAFVSMLMAVQAQDTIHFTETQQDTDIYYHPYAVDEFLVWGNNHTVLVEVSLQDCNWYSLYTYIGRSLYKIPCNRPLTIYGIAACTTTEPDTSVRGWLVLPDTSIVSVWVGVVVVDSTPNSFVRRYYHTRVPEYLSTTSCGTVIKEWHDRVLPCYEYYFNQPITVDSDFFIGLFSRECFMKDGTAGIEAYAKHLCPPEGVGWLYNYDNYYHPVTNPSGDPIWEYIPNTVLQSYPLVMAITVPPVEDDTVPACGSVDSLWTVTGNPGQMFLLWDALSCATSYEVNYGSEKPLMDTTVVTSSTVLLLDGLMQGSLAYARVRPICHHVCPYHDTTSYGAWTDTLFFVVPTDTTPCPVVHGLAASWMDTDCVHISWTPVNDYSSYQLSYAEVDSSFDNGTFVYCPHPYVNICGLQTNKGYKMRVRTPCTTGMASEGYGPWSDTLLFNPQPTGIGATDAVAFTLRPNPTRDRLTVERPTAAPATFEVFNAKGQKVMTMASDQATVTLDVSSLAAGSYLLRVTTAEGSSVRSFVVGR